MMDYVTSSLSKIDDLGRVVIPKDLRNMLGFVPGSSVAVESNGTDLRLRKVAMGEQVENCLDKLQGTITTLAKTRPDLATELEDLIYEMRKAVGRAYSNPPVY